MYMPSAAPPHSGQIGIAALVTGQEEDEPLPTVTCPNPYPLTLIFFENFEQNLSELKSHQKAYTPIRLYTYTPFNTPFNQPTSKNIWVDVPACVYAYVHACAGPSTYLSLDYSNQACFCFLYDIE